MTDGMGAQGMIAVDKMGGQVLFLNPDTFVTEVAIGGFPRTVHELLILPDAGLAYVPIYGDGIHGKNPNPGHVLAIIDLKLRKHVGDIDLRPYVSPHTLKLAPDGLVYVTCENSAVVAIIDPKTHRMIDTIGSGSTNAHRLIISPDGKFIYTENEEDAEVSVIDLPGRKLVGKIKTPHPLAGITITADGMTIIVVDDEQPGLFLIDTGKVEVVRTIPLVDNPKPAQIARFRPDYKVLAVSSVAGDMVTLFNADLSEQTAIPVGKGAMDMAFRGDDLFVGCQYDGTMHVIDIPSRKVRHSFACGTGVESIGFF
ncbi:MAG: cytochrome D1 domain-containing protein [Hyphomicrobiales bacterium]